MIDATSWAVIAPELVLLTLACVVTLADLWVKHPQRGLTYWLTQITLTLLVLWQAGHARTLSNPDMHKAAYGFGGMVVADAFGAWLKCAATLALMVALVYARPYSTERQMVKRGGELYILALFALLGVYITAAGNHFLVIYLGLELTALASFAMVALRRNHALSAEAGMKYFILGSLASGFLLYGLSMLYGATGAMHLPLLQESVLRGIGSKGVLMLGLVFVVAGLAFKLAAAPFHMWVPDVYQGAPTSITLIIATAPKLAVFAVLVRLLVGGLLDLASQWQLMLVVLAVCSLLLGNIAATLQHNVKRMLAYSTIAQNGFLLLVFAVSYVNGNNYLLKDALAASMFYMLTYVLAALVAFGVLMLLSGENVECETLDDLRGLNHRHPVYAGIMALAMLSLAGVPLTVGFYAKFRIIQVLLMAQTGLHVGLAIFAVLTAVIGAFYYIRIIKVMYFDEPVHPEEWSVAHRTDAHAMLSINGALLVVLGILPAGLLRLCDEAVLNMLRHMSGMQ
ncbi:MAG: NADH-quinone oxidoreductase subunit NuoN [Brachymonas sp.]|nr:NADH-quinone oxidoreductase subunit NuoN [Brachymonas sp.]